ncbi:MAG: NADH-quinone oxidoreductase subunit NuoB [Terracidiphilus sp.]
MTPWRKLVCYARRRSPWLFHMNAGSCNGCDIELVAALAPRYDAEQLGVRLEGSPRHADILCITGPVTKNAVGAIHTVYGQVCEPKAVVAIGSCPATTNVFIDSRTIDGPLQKHIPVDVFVPGCPPRPDAIIQGVAKAAAILAERGIKATADPHSTSIAGAISAQGRLSTRVAAATSAQDDRAVQGGVVKKEQP